MNQITVTGRINSGPSFATSGEISAGSFILCVEGHDTNLVRVSALGPMENKLREFACGNFVKVTGKLIWNPKGGLEILADGLDWYNDTRYQRSIYAGSRVVKTSGVNGRKIRIVPWEMRVTKTS